MTCVASSPSTIETVVTALSAILSVQQSSSQLFVSSTLLIPITHSLSSLTRAIQSSQVSGESSFEVVSDNVRMSTQVLGVGSDGSIVSVSTPQTNFEKITHQSKSSVSLSSLEGVLGSSVGVNVMILGSSSAIQLNSQSVGVSVTGVSSFTTRVLIPNIRSLNYSIPVSDVHEVSCVVGEVTEVYLNCSSTMVLFSCPRNQSGLFQVECPVDYSLPVCETSLSSDFSSTQTCTVESYSGSETTCVCSYQSPSHRRQQLRRLLLDVTPTSAEYHFMGSSTGIFSTGIKKRISAASSLDAESIRHNLVISGVTWSIVCLTVVGIGIFCKVRVCLSVVCCLCE